MRVPAGLFVFSLSGRQSGSTIGKSDCRDPLAKADKVRDHRADLLAQGGRLFAGELHIR
jgi:hypothetical protein